MSDDKTVVSISESRAAAPPGRSWAWPACLAFCVWTLTLAGLIYTDKISTMFLAGCITSVLSFVSGVIVPSPVFDRLRRKAEGEFSRDVAIMTGVASENMPPDAAPPIDAAEVSHPPKRE